VVRFKMASLGRCSVLTLCLITAIISSLLPGPVSTNPLKSEAEAERDDERRATWLETRNLESNFKQLVLLSLHELSNEGLVDPRVLSDKLPEKRGRHQGFCFRKTKSGRFVPYICWKGEGESEEK